MRAHQFARDGEAEAAAARPRRAGKRPEQILARLGRQARPVIGDLDGDRCRLRAPPQMRSRRAPASTALRARFEQHPVELVAVGLDLEIGRERRSSSARPVLGDARGPDPISSTSAARRSGRREGRRALAAKIEGLACTAPTARSIASMSRGATRRTSGAALAVEAVGDEPRRRQDVAQIVVDLGDRGAERGEPRALAQRLAHRLLHRRQLALGARRSRRAARSAAITREASSGSCAERDHAGGEPAHRPHQQPLQAQIEERGGDQRRSRSTARRCARRSPTSRRAAAPRRAAPRPPSPCRSATAEHAQHAIAAAEQRLERAADRQPSTLGAPDRTSRRPAAAPGVEHQHHVVGRGARSCHARRHGRAVRRRAPGRPSGRAVASSAKIARCAGVDVVLEIGHAIARDARARKSAPRPPSRKRRSARSRRADRLLQQHRAVTPPQPNRARKRTSRRVRGENRPGV